MEDTSHQAYSNFHSACLNLKRELIKSLVKLLPNRLFNRNITLEENTMKTKYIWDEWDGYAQDLPDNTVSVIFEGGNEAAVWKLDREGYLADEMTREWKVVSYCVAIPEEREDYEDI